MKTKISFKFIVGMLVVVALAAYFLFSLNSFFNKENISFYEVEEGSLVKEHTFTGLILRTETVVNSEASGYINFYIADTRKASKDHKVYLVDESGNLKAYMAQHASELSTLNKKKLQEINNYIKKSSENADRVNFSSSYNFKNSLDAMVLEYSDIDALTAMQDDLKRNGISFKDFKAAQSGIVSYNIDGFEEYGIDDITSSMFDISAYQSKRLKSGDLVEKDEPVYKLVTDEKWQIVFEMTTEVVEEFAAKNKLTVSFKDKNITTVADYTTIRAVDGRVYGVLSLDRYLIQFVSDRFVNFEIITNDVSGLKIPEKSVTNKQFYVVPADYRVKDSNGNQGFYKEVLTANGTGTAFVVCDVYNTDDTYCYIDLTNKSELKAGDFVIPGPGSSERYEIGTTKSLEGVYNINKGYTVFKRIERLESANGYCIVKKNTSYGLTVYDHIVLDASTVEEGQVLYK
ncbi:MAG: HlyD family efflux transporter periplasmic adaptor subunit [Eubacteriales bacterium]|nr:HlyD family efflux transporter periplasmic adaptor subunit [Eubacteriales bacterium]